MRIRRTESIDNSMIEVMVEDWQKDDESQEIFEERMVRLTERLVMLDSQPAEETQGD